MTTPLFGMDEMIQAQANPYLIFNAAVRLLEKAVGVGITKIVSDATSNHNVVISDWGAYIRMTSATPQTVTVPTNETLGVDHTDPLKFVVHIRAAGAGGVSVIQEDTNVIINAATLELSPDGTATLINVGENEWDLVIGASAGSGP